MLLRGLVTLRITALSFRELLWRLAQASANGERIALAQLMHAMKEVWYTQAP